MSTRSHYEHTRWPARVPDRAAPALAEIDEAMTGGAPTEGWSDRGVCRELAPDLHFPDGAPGSPAWTRQVAAAKQACAACPVVAECLAHALAVAEPHGVWGGTTPAERRAIQRRRRAATAPAPIARPDTATA